MLPLVGSAFEALEAETHALVETVRRSVVLIHTGHGQGSGVIWNRSGLIVTNHHVASQARVMVELRDGRRLPAIVVARDPANDLAALRVLEAGLPAVPVGDSKSLRVGELIIAVGNPLGVRGTATLGIVSAVGNMTWMGQARRELLQADVELAPGNSGGPLVNTAGQVVGIASMVASPGIALAIPEHVARNFVAQLR
jgi:serine protease Do